MNSQEHPPINLEPSDQERIAATIDVVALCAEKARTDGLLSLEDWLAGLDEVPMMKRLLEIVLAGKWADDSGLIRREMKNQIEQNHLGGVDRLQMEIAAAGFDFLTQGLVPEAIRDKIQQEFGIQGN